DVRYGQTSTANTGALPADVSTAMHFCQNRTNYKMQSIEKRKLKTNKQTKITASQYEEEDLLKNLSKTGESYVNRKPANVWGEKFRKTQGKRRIFRDLGMEELTHWKRPLRRKESLHSVQSQSKWQPYWPER
ncbi:UNVERIFIED_CONTAM: hypothetical protein KB571_10025, partial [Streptococcus canis]